MCGCVNITANFIGFFVVLGLTPVLEGGKMAESWIVLAGLIVGGTVLMLFVSK